MLLCWKMKIEDKVASFIFYSFLFLSGLVEGRTLLPKKPDPDNAAGTARWLVGQNYWGVLNTIASDLKGAPFGNVVSFSDGLAGKGKGVPYFYLTTLDPTARYALRDPRASLTISEHTVGTCGKIDPENPTCAKLTLTGKLKLVDPKSKEAEFAKTALFSKHSEMKDWPKNHKFQFFKLAIENIFLIDWFGGPKPITLDQYLHAEIFLSFIIISPAKPVSLSLFFCFSSHFPKFQSSPNPRRRTSFGITVRASSYANARAQTAVLPQTAVRRIAEKLRTLGFADGDSRQNAASESSPPLSVGEIFAPLPSRLPKRRVGETIDASWSSPENPVPAPGTGAAIGRLRELKREVRKEKRELGAVREEKGRLPSLAELTLPREELRRLRTAGIEQRKKLKVGKAGVTEGIVNGIHERWRRSKVVRIECEDICRLNMKRTHDLLEKKTSGLVVWRAGSKILLYRGTNYVYPYFLLDGSSTKNASDSVLPEQDTRGIRDGDQIKTDTSSNPDRVKAVAQTPANKMARPALIQGVGLQQRVRFQLPGEAQIVEEADRLLDGLGPRFNDWWGYDPQPVDADLLPPVVHGYRRPFRLLPYGVQPKLTNDEMTRLRKLARPLACHFALGRNRNHQGLASSIVKLWEKCEVAKIAVKRGVQNTNSEIMAEELKSLTGGTLLSRDREFITLYRGKDFLPLAVSSAIEERRKYAIHAKKLRSESSSLVETARDEVGVNEPSGNRDNQVRHLSEQKKIRFTEASVKRTSTKLSMALEKKEKTEKLLVELEKKEETLQQPEIDKEGINAEERYMLKKIGLRMKPFLLLGRRGIFDGTIENMHLHWKYRELVKIIADEKSIDAVHQVARTLEAESGGILVVVERVSKGHAIIVYRGKNYIRPASLRPETLLNKKAALKCSIEAQRRESLKLHVLKLDKNIEDLKSQLVKGKEAKKRQPVDKTSEVQEEANVIQPTEGLSLDREVESLSPSASTTSLDEIAAFKEMSSSAAVGAQPVGSDDNEAIDSSSKSGNSDPVPVPVDEGRKVYLSNKERLLLRKQALKMRYRPVLAVGRSNIITGVARTIKAHFKKYPLAIVNVKGRAKGTSIQEVIFMLEQATGGVLVSQEPSKVILYRGWGDEESSDRPGKRRKKKKKKKSTTDTTRVPKNKPVSQPAVSPEILDAIRTECGLQNRLDADKDA